jgi:hypothetical protein
MSELLGPLAGILIAFGLERTYSGYKDRKHRKELKINLKEELKHCQELLDGHGNLLPTTMWNSTVTSGDIGLLSFANRTLLSSLYFQIDNHNYEAKRVRDAATIAHTPHGGGTLDASATKSRQYWELLSLNLRSNEFTLKEKIDGVLNDQLWGKGLNTAN